MIIKGKMTEGPKYRQDVNGGHICDQCVFLLHYKGSDFYFCYGDRHKRSKGNKILRTGRNFDNSPPQWGGICIVRELDSISLGYNKAVEEAIARGLASHCEE